MRPYRYLPAFLCLFCALFSLTPLPIASGGLMPAFGMIAVYFWSLLRPVLVPPWFLFVLGLIMDALAGQPFGLHPMIYLLLYFMAMQGGSHFSRRTIWVYWAGFAGFSLLAWIAYWLMLSLSAGVALPFPPTLLQWAATALFYPLLHQLFVRVLKLTRR